MVLQCLYVEYVSFTFESREQLNRWLQVIHDYFSCFGLHMHVGKSIEGKIKASRTECVFLRRHKFLTTIYHPEKKILKGGMKHSCQLRENDNKERRIGYKMRIYNMINYSKLNKLT